MFYKTFVSMSVKENLFVSVSVYKCLMILNNVEYTTFKMFVTQMSNYIFVISFQLMFYKTLCYRLARALPLIWNPGSAVALIWEIQTFLKP